MRRAEHRLSTKLSLMLLDCSHSRPGVGMALFILFISSRVFESLFIHHTHHIVA